MDPNPLSEYLPIAVLLLLAGGMAAVIPWATGFLGPRSTSQVKGDKIDAATAGGVLDNQGQITLRSEDAPAQDLPG